MVLSGCFSFLRHETSVVSLLCPPAVENTRIHTVDDIIEASLIKLGVRGRSSNISLTETPSFRNPQKPALNL